MKRVDASEKGIFDISWSADGRWIAYVSGGDEVRLANTETGEIRIIGPGATPQITSALSVILERSEEIVEVDGAGARTLVSRSDIVPDTPKRGPLASPDGQSLLLHVSNVFDKTSQSRNAYPYRHFMAVFPLRGGRAILTEEQWYGGSAVWFPDSSMFAYYAFDSTGGARVHVVDRNGALQGTLSGLYPAVSPDGTRLAVKPRGGGSVVIYTSKGSWKDEDVETTVLKLPESSGRLSASPPQWLDNRLVLVDEGDKVWRLDTKRDKCEEMRQIPPPTVRGTHTLALSPDREKLAMEVHVDGGFALGVLSLV